MVDTIVRIGYAGDDTKKKMRLISCGLYLLGTTIAATLFGTFLGFIGSRLWRGPVYQIPIFQGIVAVSMLLYAAYEFGIIRSIPRPQLHRQVSREWLKVLYLPWPALIYGFGLGWGVTTFIPFTTFYFGLLGAVASADPVVGAGIMGFFGIGRGLPVLVLSLKHPADKDVEDIHYVIVNMRNLVGLLNGSVLICGGAIFASDIAKVIF